jgi:acyl-CoA synthetase (AMP-forming)/AMP-acid ligase II
MTLVVGDIPRIHARRNGTATACIDAPTHLSWSELDERVTRLSRGLAESFGIAAGDRFAILAQNCHEYVEVMFAASRLAAIYTGLNTRHHPAEMVQQMQDSGAKLLIVGAGLTSVGQDVAAECGVPLLHLGEEFEALLQAASTHGFDSHGDENLPYTLTYTSGTTGEPKGAMISSRNEIAYAQSLTWAAESRHDDRALIVTPMFHKGGQFSTMHPAYFGLPSVILPTPDPDAILHAIEVHRPTFAVFVPTIMKMLSDARLASELNGSRDLSSLRHVMYGSNPIPLPVMRQFRELFPCSLSQIGGVGTEGGVALVLSRVDHESALADHELEHRLTSCGRVQPGFEVAIVDDDDREVAPGEVGEMVFRGGSFIRGYWQRPEASERLWRNGWLHSGDIGRIDSEGFVYYVDRKAGRIKTGGETVYARQVENVFRQSPLVREVAVLGMPDEVWGEAVWAAIELEPTARKQTEEQLLGQFDKFARSQLSGYKVPKRVIFVDQLPRTALGKLAIADVRALMTETATAHDAREGV